MKRIYTLMLSLLFCTTMMAQAVIKFEKNTHDFGKFDRDKVQTCDFVFVNTGDEPLVIQQAYGSCGCTVPKFPKDPIQPGKKGVIKVSFNGKSQFAGYFRKSVQVRTNASNSLTRLYIKGTIKSDD